MTPPSSELRRASDIVERLRERARFAREEKTGTALADALHFEEAADQIERLRHALSESCREERSQLLEAGDGGGCSRALAAEAEIEQLRAAVRQLEFGAYALTNTDPFDEIEELKAEVERLRGENARLQDHATSMIDAMRVERDEWRERWQAERSAHEATIAHCEREHDAP